MPMACVVGEKERQLKGVWEDFLEEEAFDLGLRTE